MASSIRRLASCRCDRCSQHPYSNEAKQRSLGVNPATLESHGAVSEETAREMAEGMLARSGCDWALSVTGICGPAGGTAEKPVGLAYFGLAGKSGARRVQNRCFPGNRLRVKEKMASFAMDMLRRELLGK